ncbi:MAG: lipoyl(octanoyl) transferase LipB [Deltaproteobacteria bacterium]|nr:lipoyl(octanoyl) transferase LipB [Deltaproteobacteria bacterium]
MQQKDFRRRGYVIDIDLMEYRRAWDFQRKVVAAKLESDLPDILILLEHNPVITLGRRGNRQYIRASPEVLAARGINTYHVERGGEVTYHGPGQIVGYPILNLRNWRRDVSWYIFNLEEVLIRTLSDFGIEGSRNRLNRGVWVGDSKIGSIGVAITRWVTYHGFSLNVSPDMNHYRLITPCGLEGTEVTSIERFLGGTPDHVRVRDTISRHFQQVFDMELSRMDMEDLKGILGIHYQAHDESARL